ncbi:hypothetical protein GTA62_18460 [Roseobacter sp. HKCCD9010]|uniref:DUF7146 domain-containing protein n=2 Tax=unclassified Roseobacter TaxID=196798 RepID=UPI001491B36D|nr:MULTISPECIES: toprim domain-containing protein [unclassified Roseobacter]MBF9051902.1 hypothetical protein [Rhodobacterales bacterium HKCCD4356]NNW08425.1 hypothetical protein [Roseobacter sp. HKCCD8431]NNW63856.1 hypothetical protein [Roseobacter sp. HKCCD8268]NNX78819.1 hypothetical protein [Roseobacter sp. HKCCD8481]NNX87398.1 hypothetical protein [Roseobacter sp. HKCCD8809]NNY04339.1 hypothetical protein [Roseobacter sp. HKCCD7635]NNY42738.1 hypothetical protein [Roseobacter sp. HKCCD
MTMKGKERGLWFDHSADQGGDLFDLVAILFCGLHSARQDFPKVVEAAARVASVADTPVPHSGAYDASSKREADQEARRQAYRKMLVAALRSASRPIDTTPAETYLTSRGITAWPAEGLSFAPPVPRLYVRHPEHAALVVWGTDDAGRIQGGQRILINSDGTRARCEVAKPSFGSLAGYPARFPARVDSNRLIAAEGPETALSLWLATGVETWALFGASFFSRAPLPTDRPIVLAPDQDAPDSKAGRAFWRSVVHHARRGCELWIAMPPEPSGSKKDFNDTHRRAGLMAVQDAVAAAWLVSRSGLAA